MEASDDEPLVVTFGDNCIEDLEDEKTVEGNIKFRQPTGAVERA